MKKKFLLLITVIAIALGANAQQKDTAKYAFTLKQAIDYALQNQSAMKNATLNEAIAKAKVGEVTAAGLPQINGTIQLSTNDPLRRMFFDPHNQAIKAFLPPGFASDSKVIAIPNIFQLGSGADAGVAISQLLFSSSYIIGLQAAKTYRELATKATEQTKIEVIEEVTKAYYMVLINQERLKLFEKNVARVDSLLFQTKAMFQNGLVESIDADRIQVTYNNMITEKEKFGNLELLSEALLKYQLSMPLEKELTLTEKIADFKTEDIPTSNAQKPAYNNRIEYSLLESQKKLQLLDLKNQKASYLPNLVAFGNVGEFSQSPKFDYFSSSNLWYNYGLFGITMNVPIFNGFGQHYKIQQSRLNYQIIQNNMVNLEHTIDLQIKTAEITLKNSLFTLGSQNKNIDLAKEVARVTKIKYQQGIGSSLEVTTAETALLEAQTNYFNALFDALVARVDYQKSVGGLGLVK